MRILIGASAENGGAERVALWLADRLIHRGIDTDLWVPAPDEGMRNALLRGVRSRMIYRYDVLNLHHRKMELATRLAAIPPSKRRFTMHHAPVNHAWLHPTSATSCPSKTVIDEVGRTGVRLIQNPVLNTWALGPATGAQVSVLYVGRIEQPQKNWPQWLDVVKRLADRGVDVRGEVFGWGPEGHEMRAEARRLLPDRVTFHGWSDPSRMEVPSSSVLLLASRWECSPLVAVEAAASGVPMVSTPVGDLPERTDAWRLSWDNETLADLVLQAAEADASDPHLAASALLAKNRDPERIVDEYLDWYSSPTRSV